MASTFGAESTATEIAETFADEIRGKNVLITGTSLGGLGSEVARTVAKYTGLVIVAGPSDERQQAVVDAIKTETPSASVRKLILDLSSLEAVRKAAAEVNAYTEPIHILINNAAARVGDYSITKDGFESQFGVDHLAHFLFTNLIISKIRAARTQTFSPRIIFVSSHGHNGGGIRLDDPMFEDRSAYTRWVAYGQAKTANIYNASELARRLKDDGILAFSLHPGAIMTNLARSTPKEDFIAFGLVDENGNFWDKFQWKSLQQGASSYIIAAFDPSIKDQSGGYVEDCKVQNNLLAPHATDPTVGPKLWKLSEELVGETFSF